MVHASDLADLYALAIEGARNGEVFNAASIPALEVREIARAAARIHGEGSEPEVAPLEAAVAATRYCSTIADTPKLCRPARPAAKTVK